MKLERFSIKSCCGGKSIIFKLDKSLDAQFITDLVNIGFRELKHFTVVGILYVDNSEFILTGPLGSNRLQVKCKKKECDQHLANLETLLQKIG